MTRSQAERARTERAIAQNAVERDRVNHGEQAFFVALGMALQPLQEGLSALRHDVAQLRTQVDELAARLANVPASIHHRTRADPGSRGGV